MRGETGGSPDHALPASDGSRQAFRSLQNYNYRLFFVGQLASGIGMWIQRAAELWLVLRLTNSPVAVGTISIFSFGPVLLLGPWGGLLADRHDKRRLLLITQSLRAVPALMLGVVTLAGVVELWMVYSLSLALGLITAIDNPTRRAFVPELVGPELTSNAIALNSTVMTSARAIGPIIAGVLIGTAGTGWCFLINGFSYFIIVAALAVMRRSEYLPPIRIERGRGQLREGIRYAANDVEIRTALAMLAIVSTLSWGSLEVLVPLIARYTFDGGPGLYAALFAALSLGSVGGSLAAAMQRRASLRVSALAATMLGVALALAAAAPTPLVAGLAMFMAGACGAWYVTANSTVILLAADAGYQGRVGALYSALQLGSKSIGGFLMGALTAGIGARWALTVGAVAAVLAGALALSTNVARKRPLSLTTAVRPRTDSENTGMQSPFTS